MNHDYNLDELESISVRGFKFNIMPRYKYHYVEKSYETFSLDLLSRLVTDGSTAIDIGAHYGIYSLIASKRASKVYAYEPVPENHAILQQNITDNQLNNITAINKAVSDKIEDVPFNIPWASDSAGFYEHPNAESIRTITVKTAVMDAEVSENNVSFIKIDTEGHELRVLEGLNKTLQKNKKATMLIEFNPDCLKNANCQPQDLINKIIELGYDIFAVHEDERQLVRTEADTSIDRVLRGKSYINLLCLPVGSWLSVVFASHSASIGGAELVLLETIEGLLQEKDVFLLPSVVLPADGPLRDRFRALPVASQVIGYKTWTGNNQLSAEERVTVDAFNVDALASFARLFEDFKPHAAFTNTMTIPWCAIAAKSYKVPHLWSIHEFGDKDHGLDFDQGYKASLQFIDVFSDKVVVNSKAVLKHISSTIVKEKLQLLYPHVRSPQPEISKNPKVFRSSKAIKLAISGRIMPTKGQFEGVKALNHLIKQGYDVEIMLLGPAGPDQYMEMIQQYVKEQGIEKRVHLLGHKDNPDEYVRQCDIFLMCSKNEAFGRVTVEAMLLGKPVVGSNTGGTPEIVVDGKTGYLYEPGKSKDLADKIKLLIDQADLREKFGAAGVSRARSLFQNPYSTQVSHLLREISQSRVEGLPLLHDITTGLAYIQADHKRLISQLLAKQAKEISDFSDNYNKVYEAYHTLEKRVSDLQNESAKGTLNKLKSRISRKKS